MSSFPFFARAVVRGCAPFGAAPIRRKSAGDDGCHALPETARPLHLLTWRRRCPERLLRGPRVLLQEHASSERGALLGIDGRRADRAGAGVLAVEQPGEDALRLLLHPLGVGGDRGILREALLGA